MKILSSRSIYFDDVNLIAQPNNKLKSRKEIAEEKYRIISSPMPAICGDSFIESGLASGISVSLHRFLGIDWQIDRMKKFPSNRLIASIGLNDYDGFKKLVKAGFETIIIDVANGYLKSVVDFTYRCLHTKRVKIIVGNIHDKKGVNLYKFEDGLNLNLSIRVGIGGGSACDTSAKATGIGRGHISEIVECKKASDPIGSYIVKDGGIRNAADATKSFAAGADYIMLGGYFKNATQAENVITGENKFWGCASKYNQAKYGDVRRHSEGKVLENNETTEDLSVLIDDLWGGISSGVSYLGFNSLSKMIGNGVFELKYK